MRVNRNTSDVKLRGEDSETFEMCATNMGEPYRDGASFTYEDEGKFIHGFFEVDELKKMQRFLNEYFEEQS